MRNARGVDPGSRARPIAAGAGASRGTAIRFRHLAACALAFGLAAAAALPETVPGATADPGGSDQRLEPVARTHRRILTLFSGDRLLPANVLFDESLRQALAASAGDTIECCGEYLDEVRFPERYETRMSDLVREKYLERPPEVIVTFASASLGFWLRHRGELLQDVPTVFAGLGSDTLTGGQPEPGVTGVRSSFDGPATLRLALRLHPRTRQVFVIPASAGGDSAGVAQLQESGRQVDFHLLTDLSFPQLLERLAGLPKNSVVLDLSGFGGRRGHLERPQEAMQRMSDASAAPIYGVFDPLVGHGLVGAVTTPMDAIGRATAALVLQVLARQPAGTLPAERELAAVPLADWRQLRRWGLRRIQLPPGSVVRFEPPSFWRQHLLLVVTFSGLFLLQTGLILALVLQSRRRRRAELDARRRREELAHMTRVATMGELTASLAHEINQPLAAILSNAQAALRLLGSGDGRPEEVREILEDIAADDQRAGEVIRRMRSLLRKEEMNSIDLDLNELVEEVVGLVRGEMILQNVSLLLDFAPRLPRVHGDRVQLQQVLLNLMMNALDAMKETTGGSRRVVVRTAAAHERSIEVSVQDSGIGVPADKLERIFEPFTTTKPHGMGLGLAICRSIVQAHGGRIGSRNNADRGATFWITLPALEATRR